MKTRTRPDGYTYYDRDGGLITITGWIETNSRPYTFKKELFGVTVEGWTSDEWIDLAEEKAFLNPEIGRIIRYDDVIILDKETGEPIKR